MPSAWYREVIWRALVERDGEKCAECGEPVEFLGGDLHHVERGRHELSALVIVHEGCHLIAHGCRPAEWWRARAWEMYS